MSAAHLTALRKRVDELERRERHVAWKPLKLFYVSGGKEDDDVDAFLRAAGHGISPDDMIIRFVPAKDGRPDEQPMEDLNTHA